MSRILMLCDVSPYEPGGEIERLKKNGHEVVLATLAKQRADERMPFIGELLSKWNNEKFDAVLMHDESFDQDVTSAFAQAASNVKAQANALYIRTRQHLDGTQDDLSLSLGADNIDVRTTQISELHDTAEDLMDMLLDTPASQVGIKAIHAIRKLDAAIPIVIGGVYPSRKEELLNAGATAVHTTNDDMYEINGLNNLLNMLDTQEAAISVPFSQAVISSYATRSATNQDVKPFLNSELHQIVTPMVNGLTYYYAMTDNEVEQKAPAVSLHNLRKLNETQLETIKSAFQKFDVMMSGLATSYPTPHQAQIALSCAYHLFNSSDDIRKNTPSYSTGSVYSTGRDICDIIKKNADALGVALIEDSSILTRQATHHVLNRIIDSYERKR